MGEFVQHYNDHDFDFGIILPEETIDKLFTKGRAGNLHDVSVAVDVDNRVGCLSCIIPLATVTLHLHHGDFHHHLVLRKIIICHCEIPGAGIYWG